MKVICAFLILANAAAAAAGDDKQASGVTPVEKVLQMLNGMITQAKQDKHEEAVQFAAYKTFCDGTISDKTTSIANADKQIEQLTAQIQKDKADVERLAGELTGHEAEITSNGADEAAATKVRETEHAEYLTKLKDLDESIYAIEQAIRVLKAQNYDRPGKAASLMQHVKAARLPLAAQRQIEAFLAQGRDSDEQFVPAPPVNAYEFKSESVIKLLEDLKVKFKGERDQLDKDEVSARQGYDMAMQNLHSSTEAAEQEIADKTDYKAKKSESAVQGASDLKAVTTVRDSDVKYLADLTATCKAKSEEFASREKMRADEIEALSKAVEIISSSEVSGVAAKSLPALLQLRASALVQVRATANDEPNLLRAAAYLNDESSRIGSHMLAAIAMHAKSDPFTKVKKMIEDLIKKLIAQAGEEATHKGYCDEQLATNLHTRTTKAEEVETLTSEIDELTSSISKITKDISTKSAEVAKLEAAVAEATNLRGNETAENEATISEAEAAQEAVASAIKILQDFYGVAAKGAASTVNGTSLAQGVHAKTSRQEPPPIFDTDYKGLQDEKTGVIGMLDVVKSDFARLEADTRNAEKTAQAEYDSFMTESAVNQKSLNTDLDHLKAEKLDKEGILSNKNEALTESQKLLKSAVEYFETLKPTCINTGQSYSERKMAREEEIEALKEALRILEGADISALQTE